MIRDSEIKIQHPTSKQTFLGRIEQKGDDVTVAWLHGETWNMDHKRMEEYLHHRRLSSQKDGTKVRLPHILAPDALIL